MGAIVTNPDNIGYFNPPNVYRPAIIDISIVGEYSSEDGATNTYRITQNDGKIFEFDVKNGSGGSAGRSVTSVEQIQVSTESLGKNVARIRLSDGTYTDVEIRNGAQGEVGPQGERGPAGIDSVEASIGTNDPTQAPSVEKELSEGMLSLTFNNIKGEKGDQGEPAVAVENYVTAEATSSTTSATDVLPSTGSSDTVYRVSNWDGTQYNTNAYTEYGWYDGAYKMLATRTPGIDDEPTAGSQKLVKSGGVAAKISQLGQAIFDTREYGVIDGKYIMTSNIWQSITGCVSKYIKVKAGDLIHIVKNSNLKAYCAFITSPDTSQNPVFANGTSGVISGITDSTFQVNIDCYFWWLVNYDASTSYDPSVLTLNGVSILTETYKTDVIQELQDAIEEINDSLSSAVEDIDNLNSIKDDLIIQKEIEKTMQDFSLAGYYASDSPTLIDNYGYKSCALIPVSVGQKVRLHNWIDYQTSVQVFALYDNDNLPYNGTSARIEVGAITKISTGEYEYTIPSNGSQLGVSISEFPQGAYLTVNEGEYDLTQEFIDAIEESITPDEDTGDKSANYYLKGNSNIVYSPSKKLGIIAAGQSNIDGRNSYSDLPSGFVNPNDKVHFCNNTNGIFTDFQITDGGQGNDWSFDAIVYDLLTKADYGNQSEIYVMKKSMGGTSIDKDGATDYHWTADYEYLDSQSYSLLRTFEAIIRKAEELQGSNFEIKAFLWHQGEGDADNLAVANRYYDNLKNMLAYVRGIVGNPRLDFFCGSISNNNHSNPYKDIINAAYFKLASEDPYFHLVDMSNAVLEDNWHFNYQWSIYFGQKVYDLMIDAGVIAGTKVNPSEPT